jgi:hypothetical protein
MGAYRNPHDTIVAIRSDVEEKKSAARSLELRPSVEDFPLPTTRLEMVIMLVNSMMR